MPIHEKSKVSFFANDTLFICFNQNPHIATIQLQRQFDLATKWWQLRVNVTKTNAVLFGRCRTKNLPDIKYKNSPTSGLPSTNYTGVTIRRNLNFGKHVSNSIAKATRNRGILYPVINRTNPSAYSNTYRSTENVQHSRMNLHRRDLDSIHFKRPMEQGRQANKHQNYFWFTQDSE